MKILITGGAGFIGYHLARDRMQRWDDVTILDNFSRDGSGHRASLLKQQFSHLPNFHVLAGPLYTSFPLLQRYDAIFHLAGQTAVTRSVDNPWQDFWDNLYSTLALLEAVRTEGPPFPKFIYSSTNKVYGQNAGPFPVDEFCPIDLRTPYGVSKGAADYYVQEYGSLYKIPTVVLRQSCIYGPEQTGEVDQGWIAWFVKCIKARRAFTIYGDGKQVRDVLYITDLIDLYDILLRSSYAPGEVFNVGGGPMKTVSVQRAIDLIQYYAKQDAMYAFQLRRTGDQDCYVSDLGKIYDRTKWEPTISPSEGIERIAT